MCANFSAESHGICFLHTNGQQSIVIGTVIHFKLYLTNFHFSYIRCTKILPGTINFGAIIDPPLV